MPQPSTSYGIELNEALPAPGTTTQQVQIQVFGTANGGAQVHLGERDPATGVFTLLASYTLTAAQLSGNNQIELDLVHDTANSTAIAGSFELIDNGTPTFSYTFSQTGELFADSTAARALIQGISTDGVLITGTAQEGQTLSAETSNQRPQRHYHLPMAGIERWRPELDCNSRGHQLDVYAANHRCRRNH